MRNENILQDLTSRIDFNRRWRQIWSASYFTVGATTVISAALATASAGFITNTGEGKFLTVGFALAATILTSLEKVLKMREKWDLHRNTQEALEVVRLRMLADSDEDKGVVDQIEKVVQSYSLQLGELNKGPATAETGN